MGRNRYYLSNCKGKVLAVSMPERARETGMDGGDRMVRLYCEDRNKIWLCTKDADWALQYLRDQLSLKGVVRVAPDDRGPGAMPEAPVSADQPVVAGQQHIMDDVLENKPACTEEEPCWDSDREGPASSSSSGDNPSTEPENPSTD